MFKKMLFTGVFSSFLFLSPNFSHATSWDMPSPTVTNNKTVNAPVGQGGSSSASSVATSTATGGNAVASGGRASNRVTSSQVVNVQGSGGTSPTVIQTGPDTYPVSSPFAPSFYNGANPCIGSSLSGGGSFPMFGLTLGGQKMDTVCQTALQLGEPEVAKEMMCSKDDDYRAARLAVGKPCSADRPKMVPVSTVPSTSSANLKKDAPSWCSDPKYDMNAMWSYCYDKKPN